MYNKKKQQSLLTINVPVEYHYTQGNYQEAKKEKQALVTKINDDNRKPFLPIQNFTYR